VTRRHHRFSSDAFSAGILEALAGRAHAAHFDLLSSILSMYSEALQFARRTRLPRLFDAQGELRDLHAREQGWLLREAAEIALATTMEGRLLTAPLEPLPSLLAWSARCDEEIDCAVLDGLGVDGDLLVCGLRVPRDWSFPLELIRQSIRLFPSASSNLSLARVLFAAGRRDEAIARYEGLQSVRLPGCRRAQLHEVLAIAAEVKGNGLAVLEHFERASALGAGDRAHLGAWVAAVELGREECAAWALDRLEREGPSAARWQKLARDVHQRRDLAGRALVPSVEARMTRLLHTVAGGRA
jgi:hypothetical protein